MNLPIASHLQDMPASVYSGLVDTARAADKLFPFHVGDTYRDPPKGCHVSDFRADEVRRLHHYAPVPGIPELRRSLAEHRARRDQTPTEPENILITAGVTGGLAAAIGAIVEPGDEVIVGAPYWPLAGRITELFHGTTLKAPLPSPHDDRASADDFVEAYASLYSPRTRAIYVNPVHNPTGWVIPPAWIEALGRWAAGKDIWILCDEVYEDYVFDGAHQLFRRHAPLQTLAFHSFSKAYAMAGNRVGYIAGPSDALLQIQKLCTHLFYSAPTVAQWAALKVLREGGSWLDQTRDQYRDTAFRAAELLGVERPMGSTFFFLNLGPHLQGRSVDEILIEAAKRGVLLAPGNACGSYPEHVRMCFTSAKQAHVLEGITRFREVLG